MTLPPPRLTLVYTLRSAAALGPTTVMPRSCARSMRSTFSERKLKPGWIWGGDGEEGGGGKCGLKKWKGTHWGTHSVFGHAEDVACNGMLQL